LLNRFGHAAPKLFEHLPELPMFALEAMTQLKQLGRNNKTQAILLKDLKRTLERDRRERRQMKAAGLAITAAFVAMASALISDVNFVENTELLLGSSILGSLGVYWMFIKV